MSNHLPLIVRCRRTLPGDYPLPAYAKPGDSGMDLSVQRWRYPWHGKESWRTDSFVLESRERVFVDTGIAIELPDGYEAQVRPRSGLSRDFGIIAAYGTIDNAYRGTICVTLINHGDEDKRIEIGDRIAQIVFAPVARVQLELAEELSSTERGDGGFGHTGTRAA